MGNNRILSENGIENKKTVIGKFLPEMASFFSAVVPLGKQADPIIEKYYPRDAAAQFVIENSGAPNGTSKAVETFETSANEMKEALNSVKVQYIMIETTAERIVTRIDELNQLTNLANEYDELIRVDSPNSNTFGGELAGIRKNLSSLIPSIMEKRVENIGKEMKDKLYKIAPLLLTKEEIAKIIESKYEETMSESQKKQLAELLFAQCNSSIYTTQEGKEYEVTVDEYGNYKLNGKVMDKAGIEKILFGVYKETSDSRVGAIKMKDGEIKGVISQKVSEEYKLVAMQIIMNGAPLVSNDDGSLTMFRNTQLEFLKIYGLVYVSGAIKVNDPELFSLKIGGKIGVNIVNVSTEIIKISIPFSDWSFYLKGSASLGISADASLEASKDDVGVDIGITPGVGGSVRPGFSKDDFETGTIQDFYF